MKYIDNENWKMNFSSQLKIKQETLSWFSFLLYFLSCVSLSQFQGEAESQGVAALTDTSTGAFPILPLSAGKCLFPFSSASKETHCVSDSPSRGTLMPFSEGIVNLPWSNWAVTEIGIQLCISDRRWNSWTRVGMEERLSFSSYFPPLASSEFLLKPGDTGGGNASFTPN